MGRKQIYQVNLSEAERDHLKNLVSSGTEQARKLNRARILLKADEDWTGREIAQALDVGTATVSRIRTKYVEHGLDRAISRKSPERTYERKIDGATEARLVQLACNEPPQGYTRWTLQMLADELVELKEVELDSVSTETMRRALKKRTQALAKPAVGNSARKEC